MSKKKQPKCITIQNCTISNNAAPASDKACDAAIALARAAEANANAIAKIAEIAKGTEARMDTGIKVSND